MTQSNDVVSARELTKAFGWAKSQLDEAQDATDMMQLLIDLLQRLPDGALIKQGFVTTLMTSLRSIEEATCL